MAIGSHTRHNITEDDMRHIAGRLAELRRRHHLRQNEAVLRMGVKPNGAHFSGKYWSMIEHCNIVMSQLFHDMLCNGFNVETSWLLPPGKLRSDLPKGVPNAHPVSHGPITNGAANDKKLPERPLHRETETHSDENSEWQKMAQRLKENNTATTDAPKPPVTPPKPPVRDTAQPPPQALVRDAAEALTGTLEIPVYLSYSIEKGSLTVTVPEGITVYVRELSNLVYVKGE
jgi:hypothetical protein